MVKGSIMGSDHEDSRLPRCEAFARYRYASGGGERRVCEAHADQMRGAIGAPTLQPLDTEREDRWALVEDDSGGQRLYGVLDRADVWTTLWVAKKQVAVRTVNQRNKKYPWSDLSPADLERLAEETA